MSTESSDLEFDELPATRIRLAPDLVEDEDFEDGPRPYTRRVRALPFTAEEAGAFLDDAVSDFL